MARFWLLLMLSALATGCGGRGGNDGGGGSGGSGGTGGGGGSGGGSQLDAEEADTTNRGGDSSNGIQQTAAIADSLFDFDPTIDTAKTALENAVAIEQNVRNNLGSLDGGFPVDGGSLGCGSVSLSGTTVTVAFGPSPGCTMKNGVTASGTVAVTVTKATSTVSLAITMTSLVVNGKSLAGTATFTTQNGTTFTVNADVTSGSTRYQATAFTITGGTNTVTFNGTLTVTSGTVSSSMTFTTLVWNKGDCYPSGGTVRAQKAAVVATITFTSTTATTGKVTVTTGRVTSTACLPAYGNCGSKDGGC